ncbi:hypothetical protein Pan216_01680 [Planctomycetes bacterium Pan216]|uniref:Uncharacterized protein n=1 Tax=Kolteria novifilia TaxID=2527975 RepID=A0A518AXD3_9BACT|nr:hypothetical protein Pan216_01680 [Planctomycetes bacterium Pan216]
MGGGHELYGDPITPERGKRAMRTWRREFASD